MVKKCMYIHAEASFELPEVTIVQDVEGIFWFDSFHETTHVTPHYFLKHIYKLIRCIAFSRHF